MLGDRRAGGFDRFTSGWVAALLLGGLAGAFGFVATASQTFDRAPTLLVIVTVLTVVAVAVARRLHRPDAIVVLAALIWLLVGGGSIMVLARLDVHRATELVAVISNSSPPDARLRSAAGLAIGSALLALVSWVTARLAATWSRS